jgi:hypothetical protein
MWVGGDIMEGGFFSFLFLTGWREVYVSFLQENRKNKVEIKKMIM